MKRLLYILLLCTLNFVLKAQYPAGRNYPISQNLGSDSTLVISKGATKTKLVNYLFTDTTQANTFPIKNYPGAQIYTYSLPSDSGSLWLRDGAAVKWLRGAGGIDIVSLTFNSDTTGIICFSNGVCDTFNIVNNLFATYNYVDSSVHSVTNITNGCSALLIGGLVSPTPGTLEAFVQTANYNINCNNYTSSDSTVTLTTAVANPKFVVIAVDTSGQVVVIDGTEAASPEVPQVDPASQLELTHFLINVGDTSITQVVTETIYDENTEWTTAQNSWTSTTPADFNNLLNPYHLTKAIRVVSTGTANASSYMGFTAPDTLYPTSGWQVLKFYVRLNAAFNANQGFNMYWQFNGTPVSNIVTILPGQFTFNASTINAYQPVVISFSNFIFSDTAFNRLIITPVNGSKNFYMDWIQLQSGIDSFLTGNFIINQFIGAQLANYWISGNARIDNQLISPYNKIIGTFKAGQNASATGTGGIAIGDNSHAVGGGMAIGYFANAAASAMGIGGNASGSGSMSIGFGAVSNGASTTGVGHGITASGSGAVGLGYFSTSSGTGTIAIGNSNTISHTGSFGLGHNLTSTAASQLLIGDGDIGNNGITSVVIGKGVTNSSAQDISLGITGESGTDIAGHSLTIAAGKGTGSATTGSALYFQTSNATASGTTLQTLSTKASLENLSGLFLTDVRFQVDKGTATAAANNLTLPNDGNLFSITGATQINAITTANWQNGATVSFIFTGAPLVKNNTAGGAGTATILLAGRTDFQAAAGDYLQLQYDGTNWYETNRALAAGSGITADNGLTANTATNVQLGGTGIQYTSIAWGQYSFTNTFNSIDSSGLILSSTSTAANNNQQKLLDISLSGANSNSNQLTYGIYISNTHTGTSSQNYGIYATTSGGSGANYAIVGNSGGGGIGVYGQNSGGNGWGVFGETATGIGVHGEASSSGYGVEGVTVTGFGVRGVQSGNGGIAIRAETSLASAGTAYGVYSLATGTATDNIAGYFQAANATNNYAIIVPDGGGNVGIGLSTPTSTRLHIVDNTVGAASIVDITSTSTAAASNLQKGINISMSGANATASQTTYGAYILNSHSNSITANVGTYSEVQNDNTASSGIYGVASSGVGVRGSSNGYFAIYGVSNGASAVGVYGQTTSGTGIIGFASSGVGGAFSINPTSTNTVATVGQILRGTSSTAADGIGGSLDFRTEADDNSSSLSNQIISKWTTAAVATRTSQLLITGVNSAATGDIISFEGNKRTMLYGRLEMQQGADVASVAGAIAVGLDGNVFELTGTNAVTLISNLNFVNGSVIYLVFTSTATLTDGTANSGTDIGMELAGGANFTGSADDVVVLVLSEMGGTQRWREVSRSVN